MSEVVAYLRGLGRGGRADPASLYDTLRPPPARCMPRRMYGLPGHGPGGGSVPGSWATKDVLTPAWQRRGDPSAARRMRRQARNRLPLAVSR